MTMQAIGDAAMNFARTAVELRLGLIGTLALFLGVMQIAEKAGLINAVVHVTGPLLRPLFPGIPKGHPAMGMVTLNLTANMLGLGNAATPFGIKAMEELQKLNKTDRHRDQLDGHAAGDEHRRRADPAAGVPVRGAWACGRASCTSRS